MWNAEGGVPYKILNKKKRTANGTLFLLLFENTCKALFLIGLGCDAENLVAVLFNDFPELCLVESILGDYLSLALAVRGLNFLYLDCIADSIVNVTFAHIAHHAVYLHNCLYHSKALLCFELVN